MTKINHLEESSQLEVIVTLDSKIWIDARQKALKFLQSQQKVKGFRAGHVPAHLLKPVSDFEISNRAISKLFDKIQDEAYEVVKDNEKIMGRPTLNILKMDQNELEVSFKYSVLPTRFDLDLSNLNLTIDSFKVTESDIHDAIEDEIRRKYAIWVPSENGIEEDSKVNFSFSGTIDDENIEGEENDDIEIIMGESNFLPEFENQLLGLKRGESKEVKFILPQAFSKATIDGKEVNLTVTINSIEQRKIPEINDEFIKNLNNPNYSNYQEMFEYFKIHEIEDYLVVAKDRIVNDAINKLIEENNIPAPEFMLENELKATWKQFDAKLANLGFSKEDYFQYTSYTKEKLEEELKVEARKNLQRKLVKTWIIEQLNLKVSQQEIEAFFKDKAAQINIDIDELKKYQSEYDVYQMLLNDKFFHEFIKVLDEEGSKLLSEGKLIYFE